MPKKVLLLLLILGIVLCIASCGLFKKQQEEPLPDSEEEIEETLGNMRETVFYFSDANNLLVPVLRNIPWVEGIGKAALESLVDTPAIRAELSEKGLQPTLPEGTEILGMTIRDGTAKVDFNSAFLNFPDEAKEQNGINSVVYTLTEFPAVDNVEIFVDGERKEKCPNGTDIKGTLYRENINLETPATGNNTKPVTLYFKGCNPEGSFSYYVPVTRMVTETENPIKVALEELVKGPQDPVLASALPLDTKILEVSQRGQEVVVNFSKEVEGYGGGIDLEQTLVNTVVLTVSQFPGVDEVSLLVEGKAGALPEGTILDTPIFKPDYVNPGNI